MCRVALYGPAVTPVVTHRTLGPTVERVVGRVLVAFGAILRLWSNAGLSVVARPNAG